ncbi:MAG: hypothetical protein MUC65_10355 [Pontiellaceae bacterium]|nr:hypothetical protein [Pontiellaceae bacterium]
MTEDQKFTVFFSTWVVLGVISFLLLFVNKNAIFKKKVFPSFLIIVGVLFGGFTAWMEGSVKAVAWMYPFIALIMFLNYKLTKFCPKCGSTNYNRMMFTSMKYCQKCGESLEETESQPVK